MSLHASLSGWPLGSAASHREKETEIFPEDVLSGRHGPRPRQRMQNRLDATRSSKPHKRHKERSLHTEEKDKDTRCAGLKRTEDLLGVLHLCSRKFFSKAASSTLPDSSPLCNFSLLCLRLFPLPAIPFPPACSLQLGRSLLVKRLEPSFASSSLFLVSFPCLFPRPMLRDRQASNRMSDRSSSRTTSPLPPARRLVCFSSPSSPSQAGKCSSSLSLFTSLCLRFGSPVAHAKDATPENDSGHCESATVLGAAGASAAVAGQLRLAAESGDSEAAQRPGPKALPGDSVGWGAPRLRRRPSRPPL
ncbi:hypothetical protein TGARI_368860 [Toxoplasma gondii ARI]|uniref:Uncharacterized protein n=1 Tax=Toxoplasma gondii ARI TaxID=1074872 RepID=A0A139Y5A9_TOXGO|nr:hypothetical protein TGARI_368860 [Toxoplasma gondii ARI]